MSPAFAPATRPMIVSASGWKCGVWQRLWQEAVACYDELKGLDWSFLCADGSMTAAPLAREECGPN